jgi:hypothetical protein
MVFIVSWKPEVIGILIKSESVAKNLGKYIRDIWKSAK